MSNLISRQWVDVSLTLLTGAEKNLYYQMTENPKGASFFWRNGSTLRVYFMPGGTSFQHERVKRLLASTWELYANIKFEYVNERHYSDIRVQLEGRGADGSSYVGNQAKRIPTSEATLRVGCASSGRFKHGFREGQALILHEFGHGLGLEHEHQRHDRPFTFNEPELYSSLGKSITNKDQRKVMKLNWTDKYKQRIDYRPPYDRDSIMHYDLPAGVIVPTRQIVGQPLFRTIDGPANFRLTRGDRFTIASIYPQPRGNTLQETSTRSDTVWLRVPQTSRPRLILAMQSMCWRSIWKNAETKLRVTSITGNNFGISVKVGNEGFTTPVWLAIDPYIQQIFVPGSWTKGPSIDAHIRQLATSSFVWSTRVTVVAWVNRITITSNADNGVIRFDHKKILSKNAHTRRNALDCRGAFRIDMDLLFFTEEALNIHGGNIHQSQNDRTRLRRAQYRTIQVPKWKFGRQPRIITGLSGLEMFRDYNIRGDDELFFGIEVKPANSDTDPNFWTFLYNIYHSVSICEISFDWVAVVDESSLMQKSSMKAMVQRIHLRETGALDADEMEDKLDINTIRDGAWS